VTEHLQVLRTVHIRLLCDIVHVLYFQYGSCTEKLMDHILSDHIQILVLVVHTLAMLSPDLLPDLCFCLFDASSCGLC